MFAAQLPKHFVLKPNKSIDVLQGQRKRVVRWEGERDRPFPLPIIRLALSIFSLLLSIFIGIPRGSLCGGERFITFLVPDEPEKNANKGEGKGQPRDRGEREIEI